MLAREAIEEAFLDRWWEWLLVGRPRRHRQVQQRRQPRELRVGGRALRARPQVRGDTARVVFLERTEYVGADVLVDVRHARTPISSRISRRERRAYHVRLLTVPSGNPSRSAISRTDSPWTWARRIT